MIVGGGNPLRSGIFQFFQAVMDSKFHMVSHTYLRDHVELRIHDGLEELEYSRPQWIAAAYDHVMTEYGSFRNYLLSAGLKKKEIRKIRRKLVL